MPSPVASKTPVEGSFSDLQIAGFNALQKFITQSLNNSVSYGDAAKKILEYVTNNATGRRAFNALRDASSALADDESLPYAKAVELAQSCVEGDVPLSVMTETLRAVFSDHKFPSPAAERISSPATSSPSHRPSKAFLGVSVPKLPQSQPEQSSAAQSAQPAKPVKRKRSFTLHTMYASGHPKGPPRRNIDPLEDDDEGEPDDAEDSATDMLIDDEPPASTSKKGKERAAQSASVRNSPAPQEDTPMIDIEQDEPSASMAKSAAIRHASDTGAARVPEAELTYKEMMAQRARGICKVAVDSLPEHQARCRGQVTELHYAIQELRNVQARTHAVTIWERLDHLSDILIIRVWPHRSQPEHALLAIRDVMSFDGAHQSLAFQTMCHLPVMSRLMPDVVHDARATHAGNKSIDDFIKTHLDPVSAAEFEEISGRSLRPWDGLLDCVDIRHKNVVAPDGMLDPCVERTLDESVRDMVALLDRVKSSLNGMVAKPGPA